MNAPDGGDAPLEVDDDPRFHRRMWRVQLVGWLAMLAIILAALTGLLGPGLVGTAVTAHPTGLRVEYPRFARVDAPQTLRVRLPAPFSPGNGHRLGLGRQFVERVRIEAVVPPPVATESVSDGRVVYVFAGAAAPVATFHFTPRSMGVLRAELWAPGTAPVPLWMLVYP